MGSTRTSGHALGRAVVAAALLPVLALSAACSGSGEGGDGGTSGSGNGSEQGGSQDGGDGGTSGAGKDDGGGEDGGTKLPPLSRDQLEKALLDDGDVEGYKTQRNSKELFPAKNTLDPDRPECRAITDTVDARPDHERTAYTGGVVMKGDVSTGSTIQQVLLSAYEPGEAAKWLDELSTALDTCDRFTGKAGTGEQTTVLIEPGEEMIIGDDAVQFTMKDAKGKDAPTVFTVVRAGDNTATFMSIGISGEPEPVAAEVVLAQHEKLTATGGGA